MEITKEEFRKICEGAGVLVMDVIYDAIYDAVVAAEKAKKKGPTQKVIAAYCDAYVDQHGHNPVITPMASRNLKSLVEAIGAPRATELVKTYVTMSDAWFVSKHWDLDTFRMNIQKVAAFHDTGRMNTRKQAQSAESLQGTQSAIQSYRRKRGLIDEGSNGSK